MRIKIAKYEFVVCQDSDGLWGYYDKGGNPQYPFGGYITGEQAEVAAEQFAHYMNTRDDISEQIKERMLPQIATWTDEMVRESGLERSEVLMDIRNRIELALDYLACPTD